MKKYVKSSRSMKPIAIYINESGEYENESGEVVDLGDFEVSVNGIPFEFEIDFMWEPFSYKDNTYQLAWDYHNGTECSAYEENKVDNIVKDSFVVCIPDEFDYEELDTYTESKINYDYFSDPIQYAMEKYVETKEFQELKESIEDSLEIGDTCTYCLTGRLDSRMYITDMNLNLNSQKHFADVYLDFLPDTSEFTKVNFIQVA